VIRDVPLILYVVCENVKLKRSKIIGWFLLLQIELIIQHTAGLVFLATGKHMKETVWVAYAKIAALLCILK
jgi:hypothetical protein